MGLLKVIFSGGGAAFQRLARAFKEILDDMDVYMRLGDEEYLYRAAWVLNYGVYGSIEKWHWRPMAKIYIPDYMSLGHIELQFAIAMVTGLISSAVKSLTSEEQQYVSDIIAGRQAYDEVSHLLSIDKKEKIRP